MIYETDALRKLWEITETLPDVPSLGEVFKTSHVQNLMDCGQFYTVSLFNIPNVAVARGVIKEGCIFPEHNHLEKEYTLIYKGKVLISVGENKRVLNVGDYFVTNPEVPHSAIALLDTEYIAITVPSSNDYPKDAKYKQDS